ncbi:septum formation initiator family protein [Streptomyces sp. NPDC091387]|uniref:FtsB family cell division protein n=1 Tax=Streptomyces sp. NPDC091387 TaxID=3365998 RepID=UPI003813FBB1
MSKAAGQLKGRAARLSRLMPAGPSNAARAPFVLLVVLLLGGGLITLLLLNSALNEGSFRLSELKKRTTDLTDEQQALQRDVDRSAEPDALARRARELGMVPGGSPVFLAPDGTVRGVPSTATAEPTAEPTPTPPQETTAPPQATTSPAASSGPPGPTPSGSTTGTAAAQPSTPAAGPAADAAGPATPSTPADQPSTSPGR